PGSFATQEPIEEEDDNASDEESESEEEEDKEAEPEPENPDNHQPTQEKEINDLEIPESPVDFPVQPPQPPSESEPSDSDSESNMSSDDSKDSGINKPNRYSGEGKDHSPSVLCQFKINLSDYLIIK